MCNLYNILKIKNIYVNYQMSNIYKRLPTDIQENIDKQIYESNCDTRESLIDDLTVMFI